MHSNSLLGLSVFLAFMHPNLAELVLVKETLSYQNTLFYKLEGYFVILCDFTRFLIRLHLGNKIEAISTSPLKYFNIDSLFETLFLK